MSWLMRMGSSSMLRCQARGLTHAALPGKGRAARQRATCWPV